MKPDTQNNDPPTDGAGVHDPDTVARRLVEAALPNIVFDGWTDRAVAEAVRDTGIDPAEARLAFPRGGVDMALAFHRLNDKALADALATTDLGNLRYSEKVAWAVEKRLDLVAPHREAIRRAAALFALPLYAADGARAIWQTADTIWNGLGDTSDDVNWYTKRVSLSGVYSSSVLFWLGDTSEDFADTRAFIARRIDNVMQVEKVKAAVRENPLGRAVLAGPDKILSGLRAPRAGADGFPGRWRQ